MDMIGHNNPPTPFDEARDRIESLYEEATLWLDGEPVQSEQVAEGLSNLLNLLRDAKKQAETARKTEKQPHTDAGKAVDDKFKPITEKAERAISGCRDMLAKWLDIKREKQEAEARKAREEAEAKERAAREAMWAANDLTAREEAERLAKEAEAADKTARKAAKAKANASGGVGRAVSLRTTYTPVLTDMGAAARHYWVTAEPDFRAFLEDLARRDVRAGQRNIPGFEIKEERTAA